MKRQSSRQISEKHANIKFRENPWSMRRVPCDGETDRQIWRNKQTFLRFCDRSYNSAHRDLVQRLFQGVLYFLHITLFYGRCLINCIDALKKHSRNLYNAVAFCGHLLHLRVWKWNKL